MMNHSFRSLLGLTLTLLYVQWTVLAVPASPVTAKRGVSQNLLYDLDFFSQYATASYCEENNNSPNTELTCIADSCPLVEQATTNTLTEFENSLLTDVTGFVATDSTNKLIVVSFRGTNSIRNAITDTLFLLIPIDLCPSCKGFKGFWLSWLEARNRVMEAVETAVDDYSDYDLVVVGHSLGGAIATFAAAQLRNAGYAATLYTYGAPRIGDSALSSYITGQAGGNFRVTHAGDPVPKLPPHVFGYVHISPEYYITSGNDETPTTKDISIIKGEFSFEGNTGDFGISIPAHLYYFSSYLGCWDGQIEM